MSTDYPEIETPFPQELPKENIAGKNNVFTGKNRADRRKEAKGMRTHKEDDRKYRVQLAQEDNRKLRAQGIRNGIERRQAKKVTA